MGSTGCCQSKAEECCCRAAEYPKDMDEQSPQTECSAEPAVSQIVLNKQAYGKSPQNAPASQPGLEIVFKLPNGSFEQIIFHRKPLGLDFNTRTTPITVTNVWEDSDSEEFGMKPGWEIHVINGVSVVKHDFLATLNLLSQAVRPLREDERHLDLPRFEGSCTAALEVACPPSLAHQLRHDD
eukprot:TRINITY_DN37225_c0_g1_i1.p1 TRINITY_DN37225_c0_g1~~TRINITY_DN37225_c0_g1_i1.p1  ORF type:complete len:182 (+),score=38.19 TRINITY_DN37225_c0_g1_i1:45-590(+)